MKSTNISRQSSMVAELKALRHEYAAAQQRCTAAISALRARQAELEAEVIRLRAAVAARDSALQWAREDRVRLLAGMPGLDAHQVAAGRAVTDAGGAGGKAHEAALEDRLDEADLVICQTGCLSHEAYWRVQDHCRRHNKPCVMVEQPDAVRVIRIHQPGESVVPAAMAVSSCSGTGAEVGRMLDTTMSAIAIENVDPEGGDGPPVVRPPNFRPDER